MPIKRTIKVVEFLEMALKNTGWFVLTHDGTKLGNGGQDKEEKPSYFIKSYRMRLDGEFVNTWIKFVYNYRDNWADFVMTFSPTKNVSSREYASRMIVTAMQKSQEGGSQSDNIQIP